MHLFLEVALSPGVSPAIQGCILLPGMQRHSQLGSPTFLFTSRAPHPSWVPCMILSHALNLWCCSPRRNALPDLTCSSRQGRIPPGSSLLGRDHLRCAHRALCPPGPSHTAPDCGHLLHPTGPEPPSLRTLHSFPGIPSYVSLRSATSTQLSRTRGRKTSGANRPPSLKTQGNRARRFRRRGRPRTVRPGGSPVGPENLRLCP